MRIEVCACSASQRARAGALWLRALAQHTQPSLDELSTLVCETKVASRVASAQRDPEPWRSKRVRLQLDQQPHQLVLELWEATGDSNSGRDGDSVFLSFVGAVSVDLVEWQTGAVQRRWYSLSSSRATAWSNADTEFEDCETQLQSHVTYMCVARTANSRRNKRVSRVKTASVETAPESTTEPFATTTTSSNSHRAAKDVAEAFRFVLPSQTITHNRTFLTTRVGEILYEGNVEHLRELLPVVLHGRVEQPQQQSSRARERPHRTSSRSLAKALQLLQLSCQYACYCSNVLEANASSAEAAHAKLLQRRARLTAAHRAMRLQRQTLERERQVLDSALDGMRMLLHQVDPSCLERLGATTSDGPVDSVESR